ncbi:MAG: tRNA pseudouridine(38-40) synthase TruA [Bacteroidetes bacterium]|nr:tRNA pseudouridine(38-40) synthase TruA [Bacteroidota bacterium]
MLTIQYDGTNYAGWQIQNNASTIQQKITDSIEVILKEKINLIGSGRTDTGVHALGQIANFRSENEIDLYKFKYSLNAILPFDISIIDIQKVNPSFHARFDAKKRSYIYLFSKFKSPFFIKYSYYYHGKVNCDLLNELSKNFLGEKDFTSFSRKNSDTGNKICNIYEVRWKETKGMIIFKIEADRFLHGMVRTIIGTLLKAVNEGENYIENVFTQKDREAAGEAVPPNGLFLFKVKY